MTSPATAHPPSLVRDHLARSLPAEASAPAIVRLRQRGEMWRQPGARALAFEATEDFAVDRVAFSWRARFPIAGPLALTVVDRFGGGAGELRVSLLGIPLRTQTGPETDVGEAMRYLAELVWAPQAIAANPELSWRAIDERTIELAYDAAVTASVRWEFDEAGRPVRAKGVRPYPAGKSSVATPWGGDFGEYRDFAGTWVPELGEAWWELPQGRFVYWRARVTALELVAG